MKPRQLLDDYSIEITARDVGSLADASGMMQAGTPVSITFLPGDTVDRLVGAAEQVRKLGFEPVPHISARRIASHRELSLFISRLAERADVRRAFVIAGDPRQPMGPFADTLAVLRTGLLQTHQIRKVGVAGYPEGHSEIGEAAIAQALRDKVELAEGAGLDLEIVTQFAFDAEVIAGWVDRVRASGIATPIRVGIPGPTSVQSLLRFAARCGVGASAKVMSKYGVSITRLLSTARPDALIVHLSDLLTASGDGSVKAHLYPFGGVENAARWASQFASHEQV